MGADMDGLLARMDELEAQLQEQRDIEAIKRLKAAYCRAFDTKDWDAWGDLLAEDVVLDTDGPGEAQQGRDAALAMARASEMASVVHNVHSPEITITGPDTATAIWGMEDWVRADLGDEQLAFHGCGHYHEEYVRTADGWKVRRSIERRLRVDPIES
jgi:ketosteroid isomerase-like protein